MAAAAQSPQSIWLNFPLSSGVITDRSEIGSPIIDSENFIPPVGGDPDSLDVREGIVLHDQLVPTSGTGLRIWRLIPSVDDGEGGDFGGNVVFGLQRASDQAIVLMRSVAQTSSGTGIFNDPGTNPYG
jgi:hypothetical protein